MIQITVPILKAGNGYDFFLLMRVALEVNMRECRVFLLCSGIGGRRKRGSYALPRQLSLCSPFSLDKDTKPLPIC